MLAAQCDVVQTNVFFFNIHFFPSHIILYFYIVFRPTYYYIRRYIILCIVRVRIIIIFFFYFLQQIPLPVHHRSYMSCSAVCVHVSTRQYNIPVPCLPCRGVNSFEKPLCYNIHAHCNPRNVIASFFYVLAERCLYYDVGVGVDDGQCETLYLLQYFRVCLLNAYNNIIIKSVINARKVHNTDRLYKLFCSTFHRNSVARTQGGA